MKKFIIPSCFLLLLLYLFLFPAQSFMAACQGLELWFHTLLPSLLPFCVLSNLLIASGIIPKLLKPLSNIFAWLFGVSAYGAYALCLGLLCGYPMGAKIVSDLYQKEKIDEGEGNYLLTFVNHASPMFLTSYISLHLFGNTESLSKTFLILYSSAFLTCLFFRIRFHRTTTSPQCEARQRKQIPPERDTPIDIEMVDEAIFNGFETITKLGGYIILFSIFSSLIQAVCRPLGPLQWFLPGITELTTGVTQVMNASLPFDIQYLMILTFTAFGGISTIAQTKGMLKSTPFKISTYIFGKTIHALFTFVLAYLWTILFHI